MRQPIFNKALKSIKPLEVLHEKAVLKIFTMFIGKYLCWSLFLNNVAGLNTCNIAKLLKTSILENICERLPLKVRWYNWKGQGGMSKLAKIHVLEFLRAEDLRYSEIFKNAYLGEHLPTAASEGTLIYLERSRRNIRISQSY